MQLQRNVEMENRLEGHLFQLRHVFYHDLDLETAMSHHKNEHVQIKDIKDLAEAEDMVKVKPMEFKLRSQIVVQSPRSNITRTPFQSQQVLHSPEPSNMLPNTSDKETIVNLAKMTSDAYIFNPWGPDWLNTSLGFNFTRRFGWKDDGLRGHVFTTEDNSTVIVAYKGTSIDPRDKLSGRDRLNDNRLFSCCCGAQQPYHYASVCNCSTGYYQCDSSCLTNSLLQEDTYYNAALIIMHKMKLKYPHATFWTIGHSLGGSLASLVGLTLNIPAVTYEAPPERLPAERMGLIHAHNPAAYHFGNTADPVFMGACNGFFSSCSIWGFSFESSCFTGKRCQYDTVGEKGWHVSINNHRINYVIENVLEAYDTVPNCQSDEEYDCQDCFNWKFT